MFKAIYYTCVVPDNALLAVSGCATEEVEGAQHPAQVNGQNATQPNGTQRYGGDPVPSFNAPHIVLETPSHLSLTTPNSSVAFAAENLHLTAQKDAQFSAGHTIAGISGDSLQWFTASGGAKVIAQHGDVSVQAHSDALEIIADQSLSLTATDDCIELLAKAKIVLQSGTSSITLQGTDITVQCDGTFRAQGKEHPILGGVNGAAAMPLLPGVESVLPWVGAHYMDANTGEDISPAQYAIQQEQGPLHAGNLKAQGDARHDNIDPKQVAHVKYKTPPGEEEQVHPVQELIASARPTTSGERP